MSPQAHKKRDIHMLQIASRGFAALMMLGLSLIHI